MIINIRGTNGSGKSTLVHEVLTDEDRLEEFGSDFVRSPTKKDPERILKMPVMGRITPYDIAVIGTYRNKCGGCDEFSWKGAHDTLCNSIVRAASLHRHVIFEGITVSSVYTRYVNLAERAMKESGQTTHWMLLNIPLETCIERVMSRSGKPRTDRLVSNIAAKHRVVESTANALQKMEELPPGLSYSVHSTNEEAREVFNIMLGSSS